MIAEAARAGYLMLLLAGDFLMEMESAQLRSATHGAGETGGEGR